MINLVGNYYVEIVARALLEFSHEPIIIMLLIVGYIWLDRDIFFHSLCLLLLGMITNVALKVTFKVPLNPSIGKEGFAFPSGHMQSSVAFYGFLYKAFTRKRFLKSIIIALLFMIGASLIYFNYHDIIDIIGALIFGLLLIYLYQEIFIKRLYMAKNRQYFPLFIMAFASLCLIYIKLVHSIPSYTWMAYYVLLGVSISQIYLFNKRPLSSIKSKVFATACCFFSLFVVNMIFPLSGDYGPLVIALRWVLVGASLPFSTYLSGKFCAN